MSTQKSDSITPITEELKEHSSKLTLSKFDYDLYHEEDDIAQKVIRVKSVSMPAKGIKWKVMEDNKLIFTIESTKVSKKEKEFLQSVDGFNFILKQAKNNIKSLNSFKIELKKILNPPVVKEKKSIKKQSKSKIKKK